MNVEENPPNRFLLGSKQRFMLSVTLLLMVMLAQSTAIKGTTILWEEDFSEELSDWVVKSYYTTDFSSVPVVEGEALIHINAEERLVVPKFSNETHGVKNVAERNSTIVAGHWSFDVDTNQGCSHGLYFMFQDVTPETDWEDEGWYDAKPNGFEAYGLIIITDPSPNLGNVALVGMPANFTNTGENASQISETVLDKTTLSSRYGVFRFDITRTPKGNMTVWLDLDPDPILNAIDANFTQSDVLHIDNYGLKTATFDNIRVDNNHSWVPPESESTSIIPSITSSEKTTSPKDTPSISLFLVLTSLILTVVIIQKRRKVP